MTKFRFHKGSLQESLNTEQDFNLKTILNHCKNNLLLNTKEIRISYYGFDDRCNQDLYSLNILNKLNEIYLIGFLYDK